MEEPIAIVGRGCAVPGALDPDAFWATIAAGRCELVPAERGGRVRGFDAVFDPHGFAVEAGELQRLDPLFRWVLHAGRQALTEAGRGDGPHPGAGLILGNLSYPSTGLTRIAEEVWRDGWPAPGTSARDRFSSGLPAHVAARALGLGRGAFALDAACASALYAISLASDRLRDRTADLMLAGAVSRSDRRLISRGFRALGASSPTGRSRPFHRGADGLVAGEGVVLVALMRLTDAVAAGVPVLGVIRAVGLANDGRTGGLLVPAVEGQERAMRLAYARAGVAPETVSLVECHATGTPVGDAIEAQSLARVFAGCADLPIGSAKSNVGHLLTAAGGAGLLKVLGALRAGIRPASLCADAPIDALAGTPLRLLAAPEPWPAPPSGGPRRAAVSAFGFGGANAHLILEEPSGGTDTAAAAPVPGDDPIVITGLAARADVRTSVLSGRSPGPSPGHIDVAIAGLRFPPHDLARAHPQHVLLLEAVRQATAGRVLPRERTTVIIGMGVDAEVARAAVEPDHALGAPDVLGTMPNLVANRVNVQLDVAGPGFTVSAEEASGLVAVGLAARALRHGEADVAVVGAVDLSDEPVHLAALRALGVERPPGDAAVVLVLERRSDAHRAGRTAIAALADPAAPAVFTLTDDDLAARFGVAHAAHGLLGLAAAAVAAQHRAIPRPHEAAAATAADLTAAVLVRPLDAEPVRVTVRSADPAPPWSPSPYGRLRVFSGADRPAVLAALDAGRESTGGPARLAVVPGAEDAARRLLRDGGPAPDGVAYRDRPLDGELAFVFTNGSASYPGMGSALTLAFPRQVEALERRATPLRGSDGPEVLDRIWAAALLSGVHAEITRTVLGLRPSAAIGYSSGESAALAALGAWPDLPEFLRDLRESDLFRSGLAGEFRVPREVWGDPAARWVSYLVGAPAARVRAALAGATAAHLMVVNAPESCVIGGEEAACAAVLARLDGLAMLPLDYPIVAHAPELGAVATEYRRLHRRRTMDVPGLRFYSGATGEAYAASADRAADAILAQAVGTLDFARLIETAYADGIRVFVEHGPQARCTGWIREILAGRDHLAVAVDAPGERGVRQLTQVALQLVAAGVPVQAQALLDHLDAAAGPALAPVTGPTIRVITHPPPPRLSTLDSPVALPAAPSLPPALTSRPVTPPVPQRFGVAGVVAAQLARVAALHQEYLAQQAATHARFLATREHTLRALLHRPSVHSGPVPGPPSGPLFGRAEVRRLAAGELSALFGPQFAPLDGRPRLTRLPEPPMLLVDRVLAIDAVPASMGTGTLWTETDLVLGSWYLDATGRIPAGLMVEAGQADLLLISWLGVDLLYQGERVYRLLGCELTFHAGPATAGETLRYEIGIDGHAEHSGVRLFFFRYDCHVGDQLRMTVRHGQAGFFTDAELAETGGLTWDPTDETPDEPPPTPPPVVPGRRFPAEAVRAFAAGRPADCFGPHWTMTRAHVRSPRIDSGTMLLLGEVTDLDPCGGPWGRGYLRAETEVTAQDWYFTGHFPNDPCMPGTLMFQGGLQAMAFYLAALGHTITRDGWRFEPVPGVPSVLRCRGQVTPESRRVVYEVFVRTVTDGPFPTVYADVLGTVDGVKAFHAERAALRLVPDWPAPHPRYPATPAAVVGGVNQDRNALLACAWGPMAQAMGPAYASFDTSGRRAPRLPGPPYLAMSRVVAVEGPFGALRAGAAVVSEFDVDSDAWYLAKSGTGAMPLAVLMEVALQPCGWLAMYVGSVLDSDVDLLFRNLDGTATVRREVTAATPAVRTRAELVEVSRYNGMIIQSFTVTGRAVGGPYDGEALFEVSTAFGFFPPAAFADQPGLPPSTEDRARLLLGEPRALPAVGLPGPMLVMLDRVVRYDARGGTHGLGHVVGEKDIDPDEWYFKAHFYSDPVQPGSLGVQALFSLLQWYLLERTGADGAAVRFEPVLDGVAWKYRGQVVPTDARLTLELDITAYDGHSATATGWLWVDGRRIYQVTNLGARLRDAGGR